jgi:hypothetical protein
MGISQQHILLYRSQPVEFRHICYLLEKRFDCIKDKTNPTKPTVVIDASLIGFSFINQPCGHVGGVIILAKAFWGESFNEIIWGLLENFVEDISKFATEFDDKGRGTISVDTAPFQADPDVAGLAILFATDAIISGDSDFPM